MGEQSPGKPARLIKRYGNRKLYDTEASRYVTLDEIATMVEQGGEVQIIDNQTKEDLTSITLAQIVLEKEKKRSKMPLDVLRNIIQDGGVALSDFINRKVTQPVEKIREEAEQRLEELRRKSGEGREQFSSQLSKLLTDTQKSFDELSGQIEKAVENAVQRLGQVPSLLRDLADLEKKLAELEGRIRRLEEDKDREDSTR